MIFFFPTLHVFMYLQTSRRLQFPMCCTGQFGNLTIKGQHTQTETVKIYRKTKQWETDSGPYVTLVFVPVSPPNRLTWFSPNVSSDVPGVCSGGKTASRTRGSGLQCLCLYVSAGEF